MLKQVKISGLSGAALDWAVAMSWGIELDEEYAPRCPFEPSRNWKQGGPIIENEKIALGFETGNYRAFPIPTDTWKAHYEGGPYYTGATPLIAAMRCLVASICGDVVEVPGELL